MDWGHAKIACENATHELAIEDQRFPKFDKLSVNKMNPKKAISLLVFLIAGLGGTAWLGFHQIANAQSFKVGELSIDRPYASATPAGSKNGAAYFKAINNASKLPDRLVSVRSQIAASTELHTMRMDGNIMRMREVTSIDIPASGVTLFGQGTENGYHVMLMGLKEPLKEGDSFKLNLKFEKAGEIEVSVRVEKAKGASDAHKHH
jgi:periplasmic copper chaperone A